MNNVKLDITEDEYDLLIGALSIVIVQAKDDIEMAYDNVDLKEFHEGTYKLYLDLFKKLGTQYIRQA